MRRPRPDGSSALRWRISPRAALDGTLTHFFLTNCVRRRMFNLRATIDFRVLPRDDQEAASLSKSPVHKVILTYRSARHVEPLWSQFRGCEGSRSRCWEERASRTL